MDQLEAVAKQVRYQHNRAEEKDQLNSALMDSLNAAYAQDPTKVPALFLVTTAQDLKASFELSK